MEYTAQQYIDDVLSGKVTACRLVKLAVQRHVDDLDHAANRGIYFDEQAAKIAIDFFGFLKHTKGKWAGKNIVLEPWQQFIIWSLYGWKRENGTRRFRTAYIEVARKNGKSTKFAGLGLKALVADGEPEAEVYSAATKRDQAKIVWEQAKNMVRNSPDLKNIVGIHQNNLHVTSTGSKFVPLSADADTLDGLNISMALIDEYHAHKTDEIYNVLRSAMGSRVQPLLAIITTAGFDTSSSCKREHDYCVQLLEGRQENDAYFAVIYTLDEKDDWQDEKNWIKANPNLGVSVSIEDLRDQYTEAKSRASKINEFKTKRLNIWTSAYSRWILPDKWEQNNHQVDEESLEGRRAFLAIDLSTTTDISGYALCFPPEPEEKYHKLIWRFYIPQDGVRERSLKEDVPYDAWIEQGYVRPTLGEVIDYEYIEQDILADAERFEIVEVPHDPYNATHLVNNLMDAGLNCVKFPQNITAISPAVKNFERMVLNGELATGGNPVMNYMIGCAEVYSDANGNMKVIKPDRRSSNKRIDGVIMAIMATHRAVLSVDDGPSVYEERGVLMI